MRIISVFICLLYAALTDGNKIIIEGIEGGDVSFQCSHKLAWSYRKYICKDPCTTPDDVLVTVASGKTADSGRIFLLDFGNGDFSVTFRELRLSDSQRYWCGVGRPGFDTYTEVQLTVWKAVTNETTVRPHVSPTSQHQTNATQLTTERSSIVPTNLWTASNFTEGTQQIFSWGTVLYATLGGVVLIVILILATRFRKHKETSTPQPHVCFTSTDLSNVYETERTCAYEHTDERMQCIKTESTSVCVPSSASEEGCSIHIYENISPSEGSGCSPAHDKNDNSRDLDVYINPLPSLIYENIDGRPHTMEATACKITKDSVDDEPLPVSESCSEAAELKPRSLWFGLDLSGMSES